MIETGYVIAMARYNAWQNRQIMDIVEGMDEAALVLDRGAFFGSIFGTLNHLLWGDTLWMSRWCKDVAKPAESGTESTTYTENAGVWQAERVRLDAQIRVWANGLSNANLAGDLTWHSGILGREVCKSMAVCVAHMFNHQTHHRGQIHAMLTAGDHAAPTTDLIFMPEES